MQPLTEYAELTTPSRRRPVFLDCAHAHEVAHIGDETLEYEPTVSATALYLLKSLSENHRAYEEEQFPPCCGFGIFEKSDGSGDVVVLGCPNVVDWDMTPLDPGPYPCERLIRPLSTPIARAHAWYRWPTPCRAQCRASSRTSSTWGDLPATES